jgi:hypothetical protein
MAIPREEPAASDFKYLDWQPATGARIEVKRLSGATGNPLPSDVAVNPLPSEVAVNVRRTITCG